MRLPTVMFIISFSATTAFGTAATNATETIAQNNEASVAAPQWYLDEVEFLTRNGGKWVASNEEYFDEENEPMEFYILVWTKDYANSVTGRLFGVVNGKETGDYWRFRQYWHPGEGEARLEQFGFGGAVGIGSMWRDGEDTKTEQVFYTPDGGADLQGHVSQIAGPNTHISSSFNIVDGEWIPRRSYTWKRDAGKPAE